MAQNTALSFRARGVLLYMLSLPDDWAFNMCAVTDSSPNEGREAVASARRELERKGHVKIRRTRSSGMLTGAEWIVSESARPEPNANRGPNGPTQTGTDQHPHPRTDTRGNEECVDEKFDNFWEVYGAVGSRSMARRAYAKALLKLDAQELLRKAQLYREHCRRKEVYQKHACTWLLNGCWADDCESERGSREALRDGESVMSHEEALEEIRRNCKL